MNERGLTNHPSEKPLTPSQIERMLKEPFYYGLMRYNKKLYPHRYAPIISKNLFDKAQDIIAGYNKQNYKRTNKPYIFRGMITCPSCGCSITPEMKKGKYVYYHCTNYHGNCDNVVWVNEKNLLKQVKTILKSMELTPDAVAELKEKLRNIHESEKKYHEANVSRINRRLEIIRKRYPVMYADRLDGRITTDDFDKIMQNFKSEEQDLIIQLEEYTKANQNFYITSNAILNLASKAYALFESSEAQEKTQLLGFLLQNLFLEDKKLLYELKLPFRGIVQYAKTGKLLPGQDSNL